MYPIKTKTKYDPSNLAASGMTYTTVYLGNYEPGNFDEEAGSHPGVDIIPVKPNDEVVSVLDGIVHFAGTNASNGNYVIVRHSNVPNPDDLSKATTLYSVYLHLSELAVTTGAPVKEGEAIGKTGSTGQSTGEHLHFQIDRGDAPFHPYWPFTFGEANEAGLGFFEAVNRGFGIEKARQYTTNPLPYLDAVGKIEKKPSPAAIETAPVETVAIAAERTKPVIAAPVVEKPAQPVRPAESSNSTGFSDVPKSHRYADAIKFVKDQGIAGGSGGKFRPDDTVTRGELLKMALNGSVRTLSTDKTQRFADVPVSHDFFAYANTAREMGAVSGQSVNGKTVFRPDDAVTRAESLKMVLGIFGVTPDEAPFKPFSDVGNSDWFAPYAAWAKTSGVFDDGSGKFHPNAKATRAEIAAVVHAAKTA